MLTRRRSMPAPCSSPGGATGGLQRAPRHCSAKPKNYFSTRIENVFLTFDIGPSRHRNCCPFRDQVLIAMADARPSDAASTAAPAKPVVEAAPKQNPVFRMLGISTDRKT